MIQDAEARARAFFRQGYNCAQSVAAAFAPRYGLSPELTLRLASSFGGGIGRMRLTCGAACGMFLLAGLETGTAQADDREAKARNYATVRRLAEAFRAENGSLTCAELLGLTHPEASPQPEARTAAYYRKRPCEELVASAARIYARFLQEGGEGPNCKPQE